MLEVTLLLRLSCCSSKIGISFSVRRLQREVHASLVDVGARDDELVVSNISWTTSMSLLLLVRWLKCSVRGVATVGRAKNNCRRRARKQYSTHQTTSKSSKSFKSQLPRVSSASSSSSRR